MNNAKDPDTIIGAGAAVAGTGGLTLQTLLQFGNITVVLINIIVAIGGMYLLSLRIRKARRELDKGAE